MSRKKKEELAERIILMRGEAECNHLYDDDMDEFFRNEGKWYALIGRYRKAYALKEIKTLSMRVIEIIELGDKKKQQSCSGKFSDRIEKLQKVPVKYIISYKNQYKYVWDVWVVAIAFYNSVTIPLELAY